MTEERDATQSQNGQDVETKLRRSDQLLEAAFNSTSTLSVIADFNSGTLIDVNDAWIQTMGWSHQEAVGKTAQQLKIYGETGNRQVLTEALDENGEVHAFPLTVFTKQGEVRSLLFDSRVLVIDGRRLIFSSGTDVTEREQIEAQLRQAQRMEAVGQLTGGIAHDLNNMLTVILGQIDLNQDKDLASVRRAMDVIRHATTRGAELINHLLIFSRKQTLKPKTINLPDTLRQMQPLISGVFSGEVELVFNMNTDELTCDVDDTLLETSLLNLVINARDAMPDGGTVTITVDDEYLDSFTARRYEVASGEFVRLQVHDTGTGMDETTVRSVFEPFFTTKPVGEGTGLGLSLVFGFVKQSGGHIDLVSAPGEGSTFTIWLPRTKTSQAQASLEQIEPASPKTVLVIEDSEELLAVVCMLLESFGYKPIACANSDISGITEAIDVIISDVVLPGEKQGPALVGEVLANHPAARVIYMSGYPQEKLGDNGLDYSRPFLRKPFSKSDLQSMLDSVLSVPA